MITVTSFPGDFQITLGNHALLSPVSGLSISLQDYFTALIVRRPTELPYLSINSEKSRTSARRRYGSRNMVSVQSMYKRGRCSSRENL